jgi:hypothetical protein
MLHYVKRARDAHRVHQHRDVWTRRGREKCEIGKTASLEKKKNQPEKSEKFLSESAD